MWVSGAFWWLVLQYMHRRRARELLVFSFHHLLCRRGLKGLVWRRSHKSSGTSRKLTLLLFSSRADVDFCIWGVVLFACTSRWCHQIVQICRIGTGQKFWRGLFAAWNQPADNLSMTFHLKLELIRWKHRCTLLLLNWLQNCMMRHDEALPDLQKFNWHRYLLNMASVYHLIEEVVLLVLGFTIGD